MEMTLGVGRELLIDCRKSVINLRVWVDEDGQIKYEPHGKDLKTVE